MLTNDSEQFWHILPPFHQQPDDLQWQSRTCSAGESAWCRHLVYLWSREVTQFEGDPRLTQLLLDASPTCWQWMDGNQVAWRLPLVRGCPRAFLRIFLTNIGILFTAMPGFKRKTAMFFRLARAQICQMQKEWWNSALIWGARSKKVFFACCTCKSERLPQARQIQCYWNFCSLTISYHPKL